MCLYGIVESMILGFVFWQCILVRIGKRFNLNKQANRFHKPCQENQLALSVPETDQRQICSAPWRRVIIRKDFTYINVVINNFKLSYINRYLTHSKSGFESFDRTLEPFADKIIK